MCEMAICLVQEEDVVGLMTSPDLGKIKPLGDRILVKVNYLVK